MDIQKTGLFIKLKRKELGYSQMKLAEMLNVEPQTISKWERGLGMPDYNNLEKLKDIFSCSLTDILEPDITEEIPVPKPDKIDECATTSTQVVAILDNNDNTTNHNRYNTRKKIKDRISELFGVKYENIYNQKFLFKGIFRKRTKDDYEEALTQGMFKNDYTHKVSGLTAPWVYLRLFFFLLICAGASISISFATRSPIYSTIFCGLVAVVPLVLFLYESNISREISLFTVMKVFIIGGLLSILFALKFNIIPANEVVLTVVLAPITEELAKFLIAMVFIIEIKPKSVLSGLLIGFTVGAGFSVFESFMYSINFYTITLEEELLFYGEDIDALTLIIAHDNALYSSMETILIRTFCSFFSGHHYYASIPCAIYMLTKKQVKFSLKEFFNWKVMLALLFSMCLHAMWNGSVFIPVTFVTILLEVIVSVICVALFIFFINIGIAHEKIVEIYEEAKNDEEFHYNMGEY